MPAKSSLKDCIAKDDGLKSGNTEDLVGASDLISEKVETKKAVVTRGRPITKPKSKALIFHLPLELIAQIDAEAIRIMTGNKSAFAVKVFSDYFSTTKHCKDA